MSTLGQTNTAVFWSSQHNTVVIILAVSPAASQLIHIVTAEKKKTFVHWCFSMLLLVLQLCFSAC